MAKRFATREAALNYIDALPMGTMRNMLADYLTEDRFDKIVITEEQLNRMFKVRGQRFDEETGEAVVERRGRPRKEQ